MDLDTSLPEPGPAALPLTDGPNLRLNEFLSNPQDDEEDWLELYNLGDEVASLTGWALASLDEVDDDTGHEDDTGDQDEETEDAPWRFAEGTTLPSGAWLRVWADDGKGAGDGDHHASFELASGGETVVLIDPDGDVWHEVVVPASAEGESWAALPDGSETWTVSEVPTPADRNEG